MNCVLADALTEAGGPDCRTDGGGVVSRFLRLRLWEGMVLVKWLYPRLVAIDPLVFVFSSRGEKEGEGGKQ